MEETTTLCVMYVTTTKHEEHAIIHVTLTEAKLRRLFRFTMHACWLGIDIVRATHKTAVVHLNIWGLTIVSHIILSHSVANKRHFVQMLLPIHEYE